MRTAIRTGVFVAVAAVLAIAAERASAATYIVKPDGSGDYPTIQAAINVAFDDDIIELTDGTFTGDGNRDIQVPARPITIRGQSGDYTNCIIDCEGSARAEHRGFHFNALIGTGDATLKDVSIINGYSTTSGGGILIEGASPEIRDCAIAMCTVVGSSLRGGGIYVSDGGDPDVYYCVISQNTADYGGGVAISGAGGVFFGCEIDDNIATNTAGGAYLQGAEVIQFSHCDIVSNTSLRAGGIRMAGSSIYVQDCNISRNSATGGHSGGIWLQGGFVNSCTIVENSATAGGGGVNCVAGTGTLTHCIIAFSETGYGVSANEAGNIPSLECCDVYGNIDGDYDSIVGDQTGSDFNFSLDPELCGIEIADYRLFDTSPCLAASSPCGVLVGAFNQGCDDPVEAMSWGRVKALYR